jgi:integrative and conjugative element protein (TIGR02256 family)
MLLGAFDDATGIVYVDRVSGPPPDSYLSESYFQHGMDGVQERVAQEMDRTGRVSAFVGFWHTHPGSRAYPSPTDEQGMAAIVGPDGARRRALMMIIGGPAARWAPWRNGNPGAHPDVYVRVVPRSAGPVIEGHPGYVGGLDLQLLPPGSYFRGGFSGRVKVDWDSAVLRPASSSVQAGGLLSLWNRLRGTA